MPAPELNVQTPGDPAANTQATASTESPAATPAIPVYSAKHNGAGRWKIWSTATDDWFSDFLVVGEGAKTQAEVEADRLNAGGEPLVLDPQRENEPAPQATASTDAIDATTLKQAVMTPEGWLCPEPKAKD
ncbi:hypothetical protein K0P33_05415 [Pseudomonas sp. ArH3a]|uniref:hypothetical protein n=1 Tax=Pseudomonas sp. ArH3a TaxID=2862945 RepID=UPI001F58B442|nr:hypothetical protein [Pseudomonas sp. ArH3a]UNM20897.1 hypothetical protein K0P33_05415 [Pseudomonas sp. ArH3a]